MGVVELDVRLVFEESFGMADTAGDVVGVLHVGLDRGLHLGVLVLFHLQVVLVQHDLVYAGCKGWYTTVWIWEDNLE